MKQAIVKGLKGKGIPSQVKFSSSLRLTSHLQLGSLDQGEEAYLK